ncbi:hypothetical protein MSG28_012772 [Choristoneura fumiferana]|uniref:Uncharacterized protein n=1 Tax=Choristoneura fumiferana TaxID=7141 RepID=A0ACC0JI20_CHOFU|nr:hypothetical protein MSG28_012772 [Choristoneura fumiferana]
MSTSNELTEMEKPRMKPAVRKIFCCSVTAASGFIAAYALVAYAIALIYEVVWVVESQSGLPIASALLMACYCVVIAATVTLVHGLISGLQGVYGGAELACYVARLPAIVCGVVLVQSAYAIREASTGLSCERVWVGKSGSMPDLRRHLASRQSFNQGYPQPPPAYWQHLAERQYAASLRGFPKPGPYPQMYGTWVGPRSGPYDNPYKRRHSIVGAFADEYPAKEYEYEDRADCKSEMAYPYHRHYYDPRMYQDYDPRFYPRDDYGVNLLRHDPYHFNEGGAGSSDSRSDSSEDEVTEHVARAPAAMAAARAQVVVPTISVTPHSPGVLDDSLQQLRQLHAAKSVSTPSIVAAVQPPPPQPMPNMSVALVTGPRNRAAYDHHAEKRRKRGSLFFRKKKDKSRKAAHAWQTASSSADCDWCGRALADTPQAYCEIHQNVCKDYIVECNKPKSSKTSVGKSLSAASGKSSKRSSVSSQSQTPNSTSHACHDDKDGSDHKHDQSNASDDAGASEWPEAYLTPDLLGEEAILLGLGASEPDTWAAGAPKGLAKAIGDRETKRQEHIYELILTEKHHCLTIRLMQKMFAEGMLRFPGISTAQVSRMFPCVEELWTLHAALLARLRARQHASPQIASPLLKTAGDDINERELLQKALCGVKTGVVSLVKLLVREKAGAEGRGLYLICSGPAEPEMFELRVHRPKDIHSWIHNVRLAVSQCPSEVEESEAGSLASAEERQRALDARYESIRLITGANAVFPGGLVFPDYVRLAAPSPDTHALWQEVCRVVKDALEASSGVWSGGGALGRSTSSAGERHSCVYESPALPRRADTFAGFDATTNRHRGVNLRLSTDTPEEAEAESETHERPRAYEQTGGDAALKLQHAVYTLTCIVLEAQVMAWRAAPGGAARGHEAQLEELRHLQARLTADRAAWEHSRARDHAAIADEKRQLQAAREELAEQQKDVEQQRERLYRRLERLQQHVLGERRRRARRAPPQLLSAQNESRATAAVTQMVIKQQLPLKLASGKSQQPPPGYHRLHESPSECILLLTIRKEQKKVTDGNNYIFQMNLFLT